MLYGEHAKCQAEAEYPELWTGLVGAWSPCLSPPGGTVLRDLSGRQNHGTLTNMDPATDWVTSGGRRALDFDGTNDHVAISIPADETSRIIAGDFTFVWWMRHTASINGALLLDLSAGTNKVVVCGGFSNSAFSLAIGDGINFTNYNSSRDLNIGPTTTTDGNWHHFAVRKAGAALRLIVDGVEFSYATDSFGLANSGANRINGNFAAVMDDVRLYARGLGTALLKQDMALGRGAWATPRRRRWNYVTAQTAIPYWVFARKNARLIGGGVT